MQRRQQSFSRHSRVLMRQENLCAKCTWAHWVLPFLSQANPEIILYLECEEEGMLSDCMLGSMKSHWLQMVMKTQALQKSLNCGWESSINPQGSLSLCISSCSFIMPLPRLIFFLWLTEITPILIKTGREKPHRTLGGLNYTKDKGAKQHWDHIHRKRDYGCKSASYQ